MIDNLLYKMLASRYPVKTQWSIFVKIHVTDVAFYQLKKILMEEK